MCSLAKQLVIESIAELRNFGFDVQLEIKPRIGAKVSLRDGNEFKPLTFNMPTSQMMLFLDGFVKGVKMTQSQLEMDLLKME